MIAYDVVQSQADNNDKKDEINVGKYSEEISLSVTIFISFGIIFIVKADLSHFFFRQLNL